MSLPPLTASEWWHSAAFHLIALTGTHTSVSVDGTLLALAWFSHEFIPIG